MPADLSAFVEEITRRGYKKTRETPNTVHFRRTVASHNEEFHLVLRPNRRPIDFQIHKDNYLVLNKRNEPYEKTYTSLTDRLLREEFRTITSILSKTNPDVSFFMPCPICGCHLRHTKLASHIEKRGCAPGFGGMLNTLRKLDQERFRDYERIKEYYSSKYGVETRTELTMEQLKKEVDFRRTELKKLGSLAE